MQTNLAVIDFSVCFIALGLRDRFLLKSPIILWFDRLMLFSYHTIPQKRIEFYREKYEPLSPASCKDIGFIQIVDLGSHFVINCLKSPMEFRIAKYVLRLCSGRGIVWIWVALFCENQGGNSIRRGFLSYAQLTLDLGLWWTCMYAPAPSTSRDTARARWTDWSALAATRISRRQAWSTPRSSRSTSISKLRLSQYHA